MVRDRNPDIPCDTVETDGLDEMFGVYSLGLPNMEVRKGFMKMLMAIQNRGQFLNRKPPY